MSSLGTRFPYRLRSDDFLPPFPEKREGILCLIPTLLNLLLDFSLTLHFSQSSCRGDRQQQNKFYHLQTGSIQENIIFVFFISHCRSPLNSPLHIPIISLFYRYGSSSLVVKKFLPLSFSAFTFTPIVLVDLCMPIRQCLASPRVHFNSQCYYVPYFFLLLDLLLFSPTLIFIPACRRLRQF